MIIRAKNNLTDLAVSTNISVGANAGVGTISVKNIAGFTANWAVQLGKTGEELAEMRIISSIDAGDSELIFTGNTSFAHAVDTPVYATKYDQLVFKRSTSGTAGTATAITSGTVSITPDQEFTQFDDTSGAATYAYKVAFRNSVTGDVSSDSDWLTPTGYSFYSLGKLIERVKGKLFNTGFLQDDNQLTDWINEYKEMMDNAAIEVNKDYSLGTVDVAFAGTAELGTITASDFKDIRRIWLTYNGTDFFNATKMAVNEYEPNQQFNQTHPYFYMFGDNIIGRKPNDVAGTARVVYYKLITPLVNYTDELPVVQRGYTKGYIDYCLGQAYWYDGKKDDADRLLKDAAQSVIRFRTEISDRLPTGATMIRIIEDTSANDGDWF
jgi:hypothetical protein